MARFRLDMYLAPNYPNDNEFIGGYRVTLDPRKAVFRVTYEAILEVSEEGQEMTDYEVKEMEIMTGSSDTFQFVRIAKIFENMLIPLCREHFQILYNSTKLEPIEC